MIFLRKKWLTLWERCRFHQALRCTMEHQTRVRSKYWPAAGWLKYVNQERLRFIICDLGIWMDSLAHSVTASWFKSVRDGAQIGIDRFVTARHVDLAKLDLQTGRNSRSFREPVYSTLKKSRSFMEHQVTWLHDTRHTVYVMFVVAMHADCWWSSLSISSPLDGCAFILTVCCYWRSSHWICCVSVP